MALRAFLAVADERSTLRASEKLHLTQSAVSKHIQSLEQLLAIALFERTQRGLKLTEAGECSLIERFPLFNAEHPDIDIQFTNYVSETEAEEPDLDIRHGVGPWPGRICTPLFGQKILLVAAPAFIESMGGLNSPADVQKMSYLQHF